MKKRSGQTMLELVMALTVALVIITAIVSVVTVSLRNSIFAKQQAEVTRFAQEGMEWVRTEKEKDWGTFYSKSGVATQRFCINALTWPNPDIRVPCSGSSYIGSTIYYRDLELIQREKLGLAGDNETVEATIIVSWNDSRGRHSSRLTTQFVDWK